MDPSSGIRIQRNRKKYLSVVAAILVAVAALAGTAVAAEVAEADTYHLREGETVEDDLVVFGQEIIIDGSVQGDLVAFGQFITINGIVEGDVIAAGAEVLINGVVQDDVRAAGAAVRVNGRVGDDLFMAGGGFSPGFGTITIPMGDRSVTMGIGTGEATTVGGDAYLGGGLATIEGLFRGNLNAGVAELIFNAEVEGNANLQTDRISFGEGAYVAGNLDYSAAAITGSPEAGGIVTQSEPEENAAPAVATEADSQRSPVAGFGWWLLRTILVIAGIVLIGSLLLALSRRTLTAPADSIERQPIMAGLYGILLAVAAVPLSAALVFLLGLFFGWFWGGVAGFAFFSGFLILAWVLSPTITGLWLGRQLLSWMNIERGDFYALLIGATLIVSVGRVFGSVPCVGVLVYLLVYLLSFAFAAGGVLLSRFGNSPAISAPPPATGA